MIDTCALNFHAMEWLRSLSLLAVTIMFLTRSPYPKVFLIKVLCVLKFVTEFVLTTIDSKPLDKSKQNSLDKNVKTLTIPSDKECPKQPQVPTNRIRFRHCLRRLGSLITKVQSTNEDEIKKVLELINSLNDVSKETTSQIAELKQSMDEIKNLKHKTEELTIKSNQQQRKIDLQETQILMLKEQITTETLSRLNDNTEGCDIQKGWPLLEKRTSQFGHDPVPLQKIVFENATMDLLDKIAHHVPRFDPTSDRSDIRGYLQDIEFFLKDVPNVTTAQKVQLIGKSATRDVREFITRQPPNVIENYGHLCNCLIGEFQVHKPHSRLQLYRKENERPSAFFRRLQKAWFPDCPIVEDSHLNELFLVRLPSNIRQLVKDQVVKNEYCTSSRVLAAQDCSSVQLKAVADYVYYESLAEVACDLPHCEPDLPHCEPEAPRSILSRRKRKHLLNSAVALMKHKQNWKVP